MKNLGKLIEARRKQLGLSRGQLARRLNVTSQTVLNIEHDPNYNLGTKMLHRLGMALGVEFKVTMKEVSEMDARICMGNDEFILYIRKNHDCSISNKQLGRRIWEWLRDNAEGKKETPDQPCYWGADGLFVSENKLPKTAQQFTFRTDALPDLFRFLNVLGQE